MEAIMDAAKMGRRAALVSLYAFAVYTLCVCCIFAVNPPFQWTGLPDFIRYTQENPQLFKYAGMLCMLLYACAFPVLLLAQREKLPLSYKLYGDAACVFSLAFCICVGVNYFVQLTATRLQLLTGTSAALEQFTQSFPISALNGINMLGWTVFYGLSTFFLYKALGGAQSARALRGFCLANSVMMLVGGIGYAFNLVPLVAVTMNIGLGGAGIGMLTCILLQTHKKRS